MHPPHSDLPSSGWVVWLGGRASLISRALVVQPNLSQGNKRCARLREVGSVSRVYRLTDAASFVISNCVLMAFDDVRHPPAIL